MADDFNRDVLLPKDGTCSNETCRSNIGIVDSRERHVVCKLDRYQLEDRYLRVLEEKNNLKKLSNSQEDKIKRLATKLMRVSANAGTCPIGINAYDDKNQITILELENAKLKEKISVMRTQLLNHTLVTKSTARNGRQPFSRPSSALITCRSESGRMRTPSCQCIIRGNEDNDTQNYLVKIEELEMQKKDLTCKISQLEKELTDNEVGNQREKIAENVEYIRVCRQMKQLNDKLLAAQDCNDSLNAQINDLKITLDETTKNSQNMTAALKAEKKRVAELDEQMIKAKECQGSLREREEQIRDLTCEMKILQQHNCELMALSSKYSDVESENMELRKKLSEQICDLQSLRSACCADQANIAALQADNEQLLKKLQEMQKSIDTLTVQLTTLQSQKDNSECSAVSVEPCGQQSGKKVSCREEEPKIHKEVVTQLEKCRKCCEAYEKILHLEEAVSAGRVCTKSVDKNMQTDSPPDACVVSMKDQGVWVCMPNDRKDESPTSKQKLPRKTYYEEPEGKVESSLSRETMLKLLEQAQICTSVDAANICQKADLGTGPECDAIFDMNQRHRDADKRCEGPKRRIWCDAQRGRGENGDTRSTLLQVLGSKHLRDPSKILQTCFDIVQEYLSMCSAANTLADGFQRFASAGICTYDKQNAKKHGKNRKLSKKRSRVEQCPWEDNAAMAECASKKFCLSISKQDMLMSEGPICKKHQITTCTQTDTCTCTDGNKCSPEADCGNQCASYLMQPVSYCGGNDVCQDTNTAGEKAWEKEIDCATFTNVVRNEEKLHDVLVQQMDKCRDMLEVNGELGGLNEPCPSLGKVYVNPCEPIPDLRRESESRCSVKCPSDSSETASAASDTFPLLITDGQGLVEIHIVSVQLSTSAPHILFRESSISNVSVFLSWQIWEQEPAFTATLKCPKLNFNSSFVYRIPDLFKFFYCVLSEYLVFQVNVVQRDDNSCAVARAKLCIKDILDYPQNKLHYITPVNSIVPCSLGMNFGQLSLWVRLSCDIDKVEAFKKQCGIISQMEDSRLTAPVTTTTAEYSNAANGTGQDVLVLKDHDSDLTVAESQHVLHIEPSEISDSPATPESSEERDERSGSLVHSVTTKSSLDVQQKRMNSSYDDPFYEASDESFKPPKTTTPSKTTELDEDTSEDEPAMKMKVYDGGDTHDLEVQAETASIKEFNALLAHNKDLSSGESSNYDMNEVLPDARWNEYKQKSGLNSDEYRVEMFADTLDDEIQSIWEFPLEKDTIVIEIVNVTLLDESSVMTDSEIRLIYVEYSFLGYRGADMETVSAEKPTGSSDKITYNFKKQFHIDEKSHAVERNTLRAMMEESINPNIRFILVSEPLPEETDTKECVEIGVAYFNIREYALGDGYKIVPIPIMTSDQNEQVGILKLFILGLDAIRKCLGEDI